MDPLPTRSDFELAYQRRAPWDIPSPQAVFLPWVDSFAQEVLDVGCGTGELALHVAATGREVVGIDFLAAPIERAREKAETRGIRCLFQVLDALELSQLATAFGTVLDSGLFHVFSDEHRAKYVAELGAVTRPGGMLYLICFSDLEPGTQGPRRVTEAELRTAFTGANWRIESIEPARYQVRTDIQKFAFSPGGAKAWFARIARMR